MPGLRSCSPPGLPRVLLAHLAVLALTWTRVPFFVAYPGQLRETARTVLVHGSFPVALSLLAGAVVVFVLVQPPDRPPVLALAWVECQTRGWHSEHLSANQVGTVRHRSWAAGASTSLVSSVAGAGPDRASDPRMEDITTWPR